MDHARAPGEVTLQEFGHLDALPNPQREIERYRGEIRSGLHYLLTHLCIVLHGVLFFGESRYNPPLTPIITILAAATIVRQGASSAHCRPESFVRLPSDSSCSVLSVRRDEGTRNGHE
jgi:hypothetical protein